MGHSVMGAGIPHQPWHSNQWTLFLRVESTFQYTKLVLALKRPALSLNTSYLLPYSRQPLIE